MFFLNSGSWTLCYLVVYGSFEGILRTCRFADAHLNLWFTSSTSFSVQNMHTGWNHWMVLLLVSPFQLLGVCFTWQAEALMPTRWSWKRSKTIALDWKMHGSWRQHAMARTTGKAWQCLQPPKRSKNHKRTHSYFLDRGNTYSEIRRNPMQNCLHGHLMSLWFFSSQSQVFPPKK